jgi:hypothetical protein
MVVRNKVEYLPINTIMDRIATTLIVVYPSGMRRSSQANDAGPFQGV